jgi:hypothetical protein
MWNTHSGKPGNRWKKQKSITIAVDKIEHLSAGVPSTIPVTFTQEGIGRVTKSLCTQNEANAFSL